MRTHVQAQPATVVILDFGSQVSQLIARRAREANVYSELLPYDVSWDEIAKREPAAIVLSGGPESTFGADALECDPRVYDSGLPLLGICYGMQLLVKRFGGELVRLNRSEFGPAQLVVDRPESALFLGVPAESRVWMS
ncbi:MAG TPA: gamma-glutamyl-gamma-aminobutyrate hydrolase family protein, partial [Candidatus Elarobacter sp.]|nr:gamma-glutamyl-gamma-aminobutyrate hydrolase family protein [Candidatus Elarobacter sp.]